MEQHVAIVDRVRDRRDLPPPAMRKAIREAAGLPLDAVAQALGVSRAAVALWESGDRFPRPENLHRYVDLLRQIQEVDA
jgi:DNA-binding transcriptional regulator YiaG